jgi:hypothetical protein
VTVEKRRWFRRGGLVGFLVFLFLAPVSVIAIDALSVNVNLVPVVGQNTPMACDTDGVNTSFTYGNTRPGGIRVSSVTVNGISSNCKAAMVEFLDSAGGVVKAVVGDVVSNESTMNTSLFTDQFNDVRVTLLP